MKEITANRLKKLLVDPGHIDEADFEAASIEAKKQKRDLQEVLVERNFIKDRQLGQLIAEDLGFKLLNLESEKIDESVLRLIPELVAKSKEVIAVSKTKDGVRVGMTNPNDIETIHLIEKRVEGNVFPFYVTKGAIREALSKYKASLQDEFQHILAELNKKSLAREERDKLIVRIVDMLLGYGQENKASDVHIEPYEKKIVVRFRIDGIMHDVLEIPKAMGEVILTRIKILSKMRTDQHRAAQDGRFRFQAGNENVDVRISVVPVTQGENVVMRLLSSQNRQYSLSDLGFFPEDLLKVKRAIKKPHGMILVTGPTGSGKTTTLYAILKILDKREVHIATIEDPVEYDIEGMSQIQVNTRTNLTFAKGLRAIVRQDPDIIMVGEIRDEETASIAVNSAMTGHLVLSTLHANDTATTLPRLLDMGVEPFLIASTINVVVAQRLVRVIHQKCRASQQLREQEKRMIAEESSIQEFLRSKGKENIDQLILYRGLGCDACSHTGYSGRTGIFEILEMSETIKNLILAHASSDEITTTATKEGMKTMLENGLEKVLNGVTTLEEVLRVSKA